MIHYLKYLKIVIVSLAVLSVASCQKSGSYAAFVSGSFSGISSIVVNADGTVTQSLGLMLKMFRVLPTGFTNSISVNQPMGLAQLHSRNPLVLI